MMKPLFLTLLIVGSSNLMVLKAQTAEALKKEVATLRSKVAALSSQNAGLTTENKYYKEVLRINTPILKGTAQQVQYTITQVNGHVANKTITINFLAESPVAIKKIQIDEGSGIDAEGNIIAPVKYGYGPTLGMAELFERVPVKGTVVLKNVDKQIPVLKIFKLSHFARGAERENRAVVFKDVPVNWR